MRKLVVTENITLDGVIDMAAGWFDPLRGGRLAAVRWRPPRRHLNFRGLRQRTTRNVSRSTSVEPSSWILTSPWAVRYLPVPPVMPK